MRKCCLQGISWEVSHPLEVASRDRLRVLDERLYGTLDDFLDGEVEEETFNQR